MPFESEKKYKNFAKKASKRIRGAEFDDIFESILCGDLSRVAIYIVLCWYSLGWVLGREDANVLERFNYNDLVTIQSLIPYWWGWFRLKDTFFC